MGGPPVQKTIPSSRNQFNLEVWQVDCRSLCCGCCNLIKHTMSTNIINTLVKLLDLRVVVCDEHMLMMQ